MSQLPSQVYSKPGYVRLYFNMMMTRLDGDVRDFFLWLRAWVWFGLCAEVHL